MKAHAATIILIMMVLTLATTAGASETQWRISLRSDDGTGGSPGAFGQLGVYSTSIDGVDVGTSGDKVNNFSLDIPQAGHYCVGLIPGDTTYTYERNIQSPMSPYDYPNRSKIWNLRVAGLMNAGSTGTGMIGLKFATLGSAQVPPRNSPDGRPYYWQLKMIDNRGKVGAPANGTLWDVPIPTATASNIIFWDIATAADTNGHVWGNMPLVKVSNTSYSAWDTEAYHMQFTMCGTSEITHVKWDSPGPVFDGTSWSTAYRTIGEALTAGPCLEVWVARGTYAECISLEQDLELYGGFAGTETERGQRNWDTNETIIDGNGSGPVVTSPPGVVAVLDGFTIRNGNALYGGGIDCISSSPIIRNNRITGNTAAYGGGIDCYSDSSPILSNNTISGNTATASGGGVYCEYSAPLLDANIIDGNTALRGGGVYCTNSAPVLTNNVIGRNTASSFGGGGICCEYYSSPTLTNNTVVGNDAVRGGGLYFSSSSPVASNNIVAFNERGIYRSGGAPVLRNNCVYGNTEYNYSGIAAGTGDISADPSLRDLVNGNYHITSSSPCIDMGWNDAPALPARDMDGADRIVNGVVDIGADEFLLAVDVPTFDPEGGTYAVAQSVSICCLTPDAIIRYTTNGDDPTESDTIYTGPVLVCQTMTLKARAWKSGWAPSAVASAFYDIPVQTPTFTPDGGTYGSAQNVAISCGTADAIIRYTTNGDDPTESDTIYTGPVLVDQTMTLKARAWKSGLTPSFVASAFYDIPVQTPTFTPDGGVYSPSCSVTIGCATAGATVRYTTNGDDPTESDTIYTSPVLVTEGMTLKAKAWKAGLVSSSVKSAYYDILRTVSQLKSRANNSPVVIAGAVVSAAFPGFLYIEVDDRSAGLRVDKSAHALTVGMRADVTGILRTDADGERYIEASSAVRSAPPFDTGYVEPWLLPNRALGGDAWSYDPYTGAGQLGVVDNRNLNNIGLLVSTTGRVAYSPTGSYFVISDGSDVTDPSGYGGIRVLVPQGVTKPALRKYVKVTGISSIFKSGTAYHPLIRVRSQQDIEVCD